MRDGPAIPSSECLCVASLNARRLWQRDQSVHDGFRVFSDFLLENHVGVVCIQVFAGDFCPLISHTHAMVLSVLEDEKQHSWFVQACVDLLSREWQIPPVSGGGCSTMLGASAHIKLLMQGCHSRVSFWRDFVAVAQRVQNAVSVPMIIAGDANVWHPHFNLSRSISCDVPIIPFLDLLMASCRLELSNPPDRATHILGAGLDCIFICTMLHRFPCVLPNVFLVHRSWSVSSHTSRTSAWTNIAAIARLETHFDPCTY